MAGTWEIIPMTRLGPRSCSSALRAVSSVPPSSDPKPSSRKKKSNRVLPASWMRSERERASARETRKVSPPESVEGAFAVADAAYGGLVRAPSAVRTSA
jgi:hypothetical protein